MHAGVKDKYGTHGVEAPTLAGLQSGLGKQRWKRRGPSPANCFIIEDFHPQLGSGQEHRQIHLDGFPKSRDAMYIHHSRIHGIHEGLTTKNETSFNLFECAIYTLTICSFHHVTMGILRHYGLYNIDKMSFIDGIPTAFGFGHFTSWPCSRALCRIKASASQVSARPSSWIAAIAE